MVTGLETLRSRAMALSRDHLDAKLLEMIRLLRSDADLWPTLWAPSCAVASARIGRYSDGWSLLDEAVAAGFSQPEVFAGELETAFSTDLRWPELLERIRTNIPKPDVAVFEWPELPNVRPLALFRLPASAEARLRTRIPPATATAWETARHLLRWVTNAWQHDGTREAPDDAHEILDRVEAGQSFSCVEYSTVLAQSLNAVAIPARRVALRAPNHHTGHSRGHVVCEAWIDDLSRWIILDPQHGAIWLDPDSMEPLGLLEVIKRRKTGMDRAKFVGLTQDFTESVADLWWQYFGCATVEESTMAAKCGKRGSSPRTVQSSRIATG